MMTIALFASTGWHDGRGWDGPPWPAFFLIPLFLAALVIGALLVLRSRRPSGPVAIVAERYARGEIDEAEYRRRVAQLGGKPPAAASEPPK